jgi:Zn-dependent protease
MPRGWRIGRIGGVEIRMDPSLLIVGGFLTAQFWTELSHRARIFGTSQSAAVAYSIVAALFFIGSILAHELAHAGMCKLRKIPVAGITLWMFGGATHAKIESRGPADEFLVTVVGPGTSLLLGAAFLGAWRIVGNHPADPVSLLAFSLGWTNVAVGVFNLLPGFPMDGGRLLRSLMWRVTGSLATATRVAARVGQVVAGILIAVGVLAFTASKAPEALWLALIGWMLFRGAGMAAADSERRQRLESAAVQDLMSPPPPTVPASLSVEEAIHRYLVGHEGEAFPVVEGDHVIGFVSLGTVRGAPLDRPVRDAMAGLGATVQSEPGERLDALAERLGDWALSQRTILVMDRGTLVGVIEPEDVERFVRRARRTRSGSTLRDDAPPARPDTH